MARKTSTTTPPSPTLRRTPEYFIRHYLEERPAFFTLIRTQEALLFQRNAEYLKGPILDFGCGDGFFAELVFGKDLIETGLDVSDSRLEEVRPRKVYKSLVTYDGLKIPFKDQTFKTIVSNCVLEHIPEIDTTIKELSRVTRVGGHLITGVMSNNWERFMLGPLFFGNYYRNKMRKTQVHFNLLSLKDWEAKFRKAGYKVVSCTPYIAPPTARWLDFFHYISAPSLLWYMVTKRWVPFRKWYRWIPLVGFIKKQVLRSLAQATEENSSAYFFVLKRVKE